MTKSLPGWTPPALRRSALLGFSGLLALVVAGLEVLNFLSNRDQGLATVMENRYYLWKFGPTFCKYLTARHTLSIMDKANREYFSPYSLLSGIKWSIIPSRQCRGWSWLKEFTDPKGMTA